MSTIRIPTPLRKPRVLGLAALLLAVASLLVWNTRYEVTRLEEDLRGLMVAQARSIADLVAESRDHSLQVYGQWEDEIATRLLDNARWVALQDAAAPLSSEQLRAFAAAHELNRVNLFDAHGVRVATSQTEHDHGEAPPAHAPAEFFRPILEGRAEALRIGFKDSRFGDERRFVVAVARPRGGVVVVNVDADALLAAAQLVRPEQLLHGLGEAHGIRYLDLQDETGIASPLPRVVDAAVARDEPDRSRQAPTFREVDTPDGPIFEVSQLVGTDGPEPTVLRIGLDGAPLVAARQAATKHAYLRTVVFLTAAALAVGLLLAWQRHDLLDREVQVIRVELENREREARRNEKLVAMGSLASGVAHQIRNPLNTINMIAQQLGRDTQLEETARQQVGHVRTESARIEGIVQQFLQFARPREPRPEPLDVGATIREVARAQQASFSASDLRLRVQVHPLRASLDRAFLVEIVENLLRNAREASPPGTEVALIAGAIGDRIEIEVRDEGPGIPDDLRERVFDLYFTTKSTGSGVGLSLVARMVSAMGGEVRVGNRATGGATFVVRLPREART